MLESVEVFFHVSCQLYVYMFVLVIPLDVECRIKFPLPIDCGFIILGVLG